MIDVEKLRKELATEVMGWRSFGDQWMDSKDIRVWKKKSWRPDENIDQALILVEHLKMSCMIVRNHDGTWRAFIGGMRSNPGQAKVEKVVRLALTQMQRTCIARGIS